jgi:glycosyltransferase involved in cell wall biosynthesis
VPAPDISVVINTRSRARRLEALLHSIAEQRGVDREVVVVDNGSTDATPELLRRGVPGLRLRSLWVEPEAGPAAARNAGWQLADGALIVFADDDVRADPHWLLAFLEAHRSQPDAVLQGLTDADPEELARSRVFHRTRAYDGPSDWYPTCNIAYPRELLEHLGGFDESFGRAMGEDTDLGWRAREAGRERVFVAAARVSHAVHQVGLIGSLRDTLRVQDMAAVLRRHRELRGALHHRVFLTPEHEQLLAALTGVALARRTRGGSLALAVPYLLGRRRRHPGWAGALASTPGYVLIDAAEILVLVVGSGRNRTLLL